MMAALAEEGWVGMTAVADSAAEADETYKRAIAILDEEATSALT